MFGASGTFRRRIDKQQRLALQYSSIITCIDPQQVMKVNGTPVTVGIALQNLFAWVDPVTPYEKQLSRNGGYFQTLLAVKRGTWK